MYDDFDDYFYPAEDNYHEDMLMQEAEDFYNDFYGDDVKGGFWGSNLLNKK